MGCLEFGRGPGPLRPHLRWRAWLLRTFTGGATLVTNIWGSVFAAPRPGHLAWDPDPTGIVLHAIAPVLLILLAEAAPRYRAAFAAITTTLTCPDMPTNGPDTATAGAAGPSPHPAPVAAHGGHHGPSPGPAAAAGTGPAYRRGDREATARALVAEEPGITGAELARRLGLKTRTGQRIRNRINADDETRNRIGVGEWAPGGEVLRESDG